MRKLIGAALLGMLASGAAQAEVLVFDFKAVIETVTELQYSNGETQGTVVPSSTRNGSLIVTGDTISGRFYYDTATPFDQYYPANFPTLGGAAAYNNVGIAPTNAGTQHTFDRTGNSYVSKQDIYPFFVLNNAAGAGSDLFRVEGKRLIECRCSAIYEESNVTFLDTTGAVLSSDAIPAALNLADWSSAVYTYNWNSDNFVDRLQVSARLTALTPVVTSPVPEPATLGMMAIGMLLVGRRLRSANFAVDPVGIKPAGGAAGTAA